MNYLNDLAADIEGWKRDGRYRTIKVWESGSDTWMNLNGRKILQMSSIIIWD